MAMDPARVSLRRSVLASSIFVLLWLTLFWTLADEPIELARQHGALVLVGLVGAVIGNATAVGGGIVFVPYMLLFYRLDPLSSLALALATQAFGMTSGAIAWWRAGSVTHDMLRSTVPAVVSGVVLGSLVRAPAPSEIKLVFSLVSIAIGGLVLVMLAQRSSRTVVPNKAGLGLFVVALLGTLITCWAAIGVGEVVAAWLILRWRLVPERAIATGVVLLAGASLSLALIHQLWLGGIPWHLTGFVVLGAVFGAQLGPRVASRMPPGLLKVVFALVAIVDGLILLTTSVGC